MKARSLFHLILRVVKHAKTNCEPHDKLLASQLNELAENLEIKEKKPDYKVKSKIGEKLIGVSYPTSSFAFFNAAKKGDKIENWREARQIVAQILSQVSPDNENLVRFFELATLADEEKSIKFEDFFITQNFKEAFLILVFGLSSIVAVLEVISENLIPPLIGFFLGSAIATLVVATLVMQFLANRFFKMRQGVECLFICAPIVLSVVLLVDLYWFHLVSFAAIFLFISTIEIVSKPQSGDKRLLLSAGFLAAGTCYCALFLESVAVWTGMNEFLLIACLLFGLFKIILGDRTNLLIIVASASFFALFTSGSLGAFDFIRQFFGLAATDGLTVRPTQLAVSLLFVIVAIWLLSFATIKHFLSFVSVLALLVGYMITAFSMGNIQAIAGPISVILISLLAGFATQVFLDSDATRLAEKLSN